MLKQRQIQNKGKSKLGETLLKPIKWSNFNEAEKHQFYWYLINNIQFLNIINDQFNMQDLNDIWRLSFYLWI